MKQFFRTVLFLTLSLSLFAGTPLTYEDIQNLSTQEKAEKLAPIDPGQRWPIMSRLAPAESQQIYKLIYEINQRSGQTAPASAADGTASRPNQPASATVNYSNVLASAKAVPLDIFRITDKVQISNPPNFGMNMPWIFSFKPWSGTRLINVWNEQSSMEPIEMRHSQVLERTGTPNGRDYIAENWQAQSPQRGGLSWWGLMPDGVWNGAELRLYRLSGDEYKLLHKTTVKNFHAIRNQTERKDDARIDFTDPLPEGVEPAKAGDIILLTATVDELNIPDASQQSKGNGFFQSFNGAKWKMDRTTFAPEGGSTASMRVTLGANESGMKHPYIIDAPAEKNYLRFLDGAEYKAQVWLRQEGIGSGQVTVQIGAFAKETFSVGDEWKKYELSLDTAPARIPGGDVPLQISAKGPGTLWIDNLLVYQEGTPKFKPLPYVTKALKDFQPGTLRIWDGLNKFTLDALLLEGFEGRSVWEGQRRRVDGNNGPSLNAMLELCQTSGAQPWLILYPLYTEEEIQRLMEYLGAPADTGYGKLRAQHGHTEPWTEVFSNITIECANESWNSIFTPIAYPSSPETYGAIANRMFRLIETAPYFKDEQFTFMLNGAFVNMGWTGRAINTCTEAEATDWGLYYGGADGLTVLGSDDTDLYGKQLLYNERIVAPIMEDAEKLLADIKAKTGRDIKQAVYEGGPGYALPTPGKPYTETSETVGKSLATGILTLDAFMYNLSHGFVAMNYYLFETGNNWSTHNNQNEMIPYTSWLALLLRNRFCSGDLMTVEPVKIKTIDFPTEIAEKLDYRGVNKVKKTIKARSDIPLVLCYAFRNGSTNTVLLINRAYNEERTVQLELSFSPESAVTIRKLTAPDPRTANRTEQNVDIQIETRNDFESGYTITIPPSSAFVLTSKAR